MKGVILAGGQGTRLQPLTNVLNKHLLPVGPVPMIYYPIQRLVEAGIKDILIITGPEDIGSIANQLGSGKEWGAKFTFKVQDTPGGIAHAVSFAEDFVNGESMVVILGDNLFSDSLSPYIKNFLSERKEAKLFLKRVEDPERFGVAVLNNGEVTEVIEKPKSYKSDLAVTGIYMYTPEVFKIIKNLSPSGRGELEITDVNNQFIKEKKVSAEILEGEWIDAGTRESLELASKLAKVMNLDLKE
jgi:glucose-1-phosphate thymidylyltransferase